MQPQAFTVDLSIRNDFSDLVAVTEALDQVGGEFGFAPKALIQLQVALDEILSNVIKYAWSDGAPHTLRVRIKASVPSIEVVVTDDGAPFDPRAQPEPEPARGRRLRPGGVGIHLIKQLVDEFDYARTGGVNCVTLIKRNILDPALPHGVDDGH
jgi:serine/threonine-protein kinase RsbW